MKIKLAILEQDKSYLNRITAVFNTKYTDKFEVYSFTDKDVTLASLESSKIDVLLADDEFEIDCTQLPKRCGIAYLVESQGIQTVNNQTAIFKYQKVELIYKQVLSVYSDKASNVSGIKLDNDSCRVTMFTGAAGGVGASCMAAAAALAFTAAGRRTLYLNLEKTGDTANFFDAPGQYDMSDVVFALKNRKSNLALKLESCVRQDQRGVYYFQSPRIALDMMSLNTEETIQLITELRTSGAYDEIVVDADFSLEKSNLPLYGAMHAIVLVTDGSEIANSKTVRAAEAISVMDQRSDVPLMNRMALVYNKASSSSSQMIENMPIRSIGHTPRYSHAAVAQIVDQLSRLEVYSQI